VKFTLEDPAGGESFVVEGVVVGGVDVGVDVWFKPGILLPPRII